MCYFIDGKRVCATKGAVAYASMQINNTPEASLGEFSDHLMELLRKGTLVLDACRVKGIEQLAFLNKASKDSASASIIGFGSLENIPVAMKISFASSEDDNSLEVERNVYERLSPVFRECTPHVLPFVALKSCPNFRQVLEKEVEEKKSDNNWGAQRLLEAVEDLVSDDENFDTSGEAHFLFTIRTSGDTLEDVVRRLEKHEVDSFVHDVLFQVAYTLTAFGRLGLMHNDLHDGNIFIETLQVPRTTYYRVGQEVFKRTSRFVAYIFDFDQASKHPFPASAVELSNSLLETDLCGRYGVCNKFTPNKDWFKFLYHLRELLKDVRSDALKLVEGLMGTPAVPQPPENTEYKDESRLCVCNSGDEECESCHVLDAFFAHMRPPVELLRSVRYRNSVTTHVPRGQQVFRLPDTKARKPRKYHKAARTPQNASLSGEEKKPKPLPITNAPATNWWRWWW
jgi:hypothetical protein